MANYTTNLKSWGATGLEYPDEYNYEDNVPPVDKYDNFLTNNLINDIQHLIQATNKRIESASGSSGNEPTSPEPTHLYGDETNNRIEAWDGSVSAWRDLMFRDGDTMTGALSMGGNGISGVGTVTDNSGNTIFDNANSHIPTSIIQQGSGSGLDADTVDGSDATDIATDVSDNSTLISSKATDINFAQNLSVTSVGDGAVKIDSVDQEGTHTAVSENGTQNVGSVDDINFEGYLNVIDDGDNTVSIDPTHNHDSRYFRKNQSGHIDFSSRDRMNLPERSSDPSTTTPGDMWYRSDLD